MGGEVEPGFGLRMSHLFSPRVAPPQAEGGAGGAAGADGRGAERWEERGARLRLWSGRGAWVRKTAELWEHQQCQNCRGERGRGSPGRGIRPSLNAPFRDCARVQARVPRFLWGAQLALSTEPRPRPRSRIPSPGPLDYRKAVRGGAHVDASRRSSRGAE